MKQHRSKIALTLQFSQRDHLPTITEGQPIDIGIIGPSLKLPFPLTCQSPNDDWHIEGDTNDNHNNVSEISRLGDVVEPFVTTTTLSLISDLDLLSSASNPTETTTCDTLPRGKASSQALVDQHLRQLEWATTKILAQPERALMIYQRMRGKNMVRQVSFLDDLTKKYSCQCCGVTLSQYETHEEHGHLGAPNDKLN